MATAGWIAFDLTNSQAILLDGNFSFVLAIATIIAIYISKNKHKKTATFPYGSYVFEAAFVLSKGLLILGIIVMAFIQNAIKIIEYFQGKKIEPVVMVPIYYYTVFILIFTMILLLFFNHQNKKINNKSGLLLVEAESAKIDGVLTLAMGLAFLLISFIGVGSRFEFLLYVGDSIIVIIISLIMVGSPLKIIKSSFIELGGGSIENQQEKEEIENAINEVIKDGFSFSTFISKVGSGYLVVVYIEAQNDDYSIKEYRLVQQEIKQKLKDSFPVIAVEIALKS
jgi:predicted Co/Zn/Cd cation transporter (cation efflux family)